MFPGTHFSDMAMDLLGGVTGTVYLCFRAPNDHFYTRLRLMLCFDPKWAGLPPLATGAKEDWLGTGIDRWEGSKPNTRAYSESCSTAAGPCEPDPPSYPWIGCSQHLNTPARRVHAQVKPVQKVPGQRPSQPKAFSNRAWGCGWG